MRSRDSIPEVEDEDLNEMEDTMIEIDWEEIEEEIREEIEEEIREELRKMEQKLEKGGVERMKSKNYMEL